MFAEITQSDERLAHALELKEQLDQTLINLGFQYDVEGWDDSLDLTDPQNAEHIALVINNILVQNFDRNSKREGQMQQLMDLQMAIPNELSLVRSCVHLFADGIKMAGE